MVILLFPIVSGSGGGASAGAFNFGRSIGDSDDNYGFRLVLKHKSIGELQ